MTLRVIRTNESSKIAAVAAPYLQGDTVLDIGCGPHKVWPSVIGIETRTAPMYDTVDLRCDAANLQMFAEVDAIFSSYFLDRLQDKHEVRSVLGVWAQKIRIDGHLVLYVPNSSVVQPQQLDAEHRVQFYEGDIPEIMSDVAAQTNTAWSMLECEARNDYGEHSLFYVFKRVLGSGVLKDNRWQNRVAGKKTALVIRYGAIGDIVQTLPVIDALHKEGYHVSVNCRTDSVTLLRWDERVAEILPQARDFVPNRELQYYWQALGQRYDRVVNLSECVEGSLLALPERVQAHYPVAVRRKLFDHVNYVERMGVIADVVVRPEAAVVRIHTSELETASQMLSAMKTDNNPVVVICMNGSAPHKVYPHNAVVIHHLLQQTNCIVVLMGAGEVSRALADAIKHQLGYSHDRLHDCVDILPIRRSIAVATISDCVVGPETGILNAVGMHTVPKVLLLSHSTHDNLSRDWLNVSPIHSETACGPCHIMHKDWSLCPRSADTMAALCASKIHPQIVVDKILSALSQRTECVLSKAPEM